MIVLHVVANYDRILCGCKTMIVFYEVANYDHINIINQRAWGNNNIGVDPVKYICICPLLQKLLQTLVMALKLS